MTIDGLLQAASEENTGRSQQRDVPSEDNDQQQEAPGAIASEARALRKPEPPYTRVDPRTKGRKEQEQDYVKWVTGANRIVNKVKKRTALKRRQTRSQTQE